MHWDFLGAAHLLAPRAQVLDVPVLHVPLNGVLQVGEGAVVKGCVVARGFQSLTWCKLIELSYMLRDLK